MSVKVSRVIEGEALEREGLGRLPVPISTPGFDNTPCRRSSVRQRRG
jgi:hypothetical protein